MNRREFILGSLGGLQPPVANPLGQRTSSSVEQPPSTSHQSPTTNHYDLVVAGGGPAGIAAAVTAARLGAKVALLELKGSLGGVWTSGLLGCMICFDKTDLDREITARLREMGAMLPRRPGDVRSYSSNYVYEPEYMKIVLDDLVTGAGVDFRLHTHVVAVERRGRDIAAVFTESKSGRERWEAKTFIDATGDGDLGAFAGCGFDTGDGHGGPDQPASLEAVLAIPENEGLRPFVANDPFNYTAEGKRRVNAKKVLLKELLRVGINPSYHDPTLWRIHPGLFILAADHQYGVKVDDSAAITQATVRARRDLFNLTEALARRGGEAWRGLRLVQTAEQIGHRGARRLHGRYTLTVDDVAAGRTFEDAVVTSTFGIDVHATTFAANRELAAGTPKGIHFKPFQIPLRACRAKDVDNLYMAGRCISGDFIPQASYRVTGTAIATGIAVAKHAVSAS